MYVHRAKQLERLLPYRERWDELAGGCVFRSWTWLTTWWKHYGQTGATQELAALLVFAGDESTLAVPKEVDPEDSTRLVAILPAYLENSLTRGNVLRLLGDGEACSDHLDLLVESSERGHAAQALSKYLTECWSDWDLIDFTAVDKDEASLKHLFEALAAQGCSLSREVRLSTWAIELPYSWEGFLAQQSKSHRKQLRRLEKRVLETKQAIWHLAGTAQEFEIAWAILVDLHQRRRQSLGEPGCFASDKWASFHRVVARQLHQAGQLRLSWLELGGQPAAAEYHLAGASKTFAYQGGIDPDRLEEEPGRLSMICSVQHAIAEGHRQFDLLRGDEPYKAHWRAVPRETWDVQVVPSRSSARLRFQAWTYLRRAKNLAQEFAANA